MDSNLEIRFPCQVCHILTALQRELLNAGRFMYMFLHQLDLFLTTENTRFVSIDGYNVLTLHLLHDQQHY